MSPAFKLTEKGEPIEVGVAYATDLEHSERTHFNAIVLCLATISIDHWVIISWFRLTVLARALREPRRPSSFFAIELRIFLLFIDVHQMFLLYLREIK